MPTLALLCTLLTFAVAAQGPTMRGRVLDEEGKPIAGVAACPFLEGELFVTAELTARPAATSDADGVFTLAAPPPGDRAWYRVLLVAPGRLHLEATREDLERFPVLLPRARLLAGRVRDAQGRPIAGVRVEATDLLNEVEYVLGGDRQRLEAQARTATRTDARGAFVLVGACESAARVSIADVGWQPTSVAPVSAMEPIELLGEPAPTFRGVVVDPEGVPVANAIASAHSTVAKETARTDDAGAFVLHAGPRGMTVSAHLRRADQRLWALEQVAAGVLEARLTLKVLAPVASRVRSRDPVTPARTVRGRAVDAEGQPVTHFRAAAFRIRKPQGLTPTDARPLRDFTPGATDANEGVATPAMYELAGRGIPDTILLVLVLGDGFALACHQAEEATDAVEVRLAPAHALTGTIVDAKTRAPIAGAQVWSIPHLGAPLPPGFEGVPVIRAIDPFRSGRAEASSLASASAANGTFRLEQLPAGVCTVLCVAEGYKDAQPSKLVVGPTNGELQIALDPLRSLTGTLKIRTPPLAVAVRLAPHRPNTWSSGDATDYSSSFALDAEGRFRTGPLPTGKYEAQLIVLRPGRQGLPDKIPLGLVDVGLDTEDLRLDGSSARPAQVRGRVESDVPVHRLAVLSAPAAAGRSFFGYVQYTGPLCPLGADGSFSLPEPPGPRLLVVIDVWTGAMLWRSDEVEVEPGGKREVDVRVSATPVAFQLAGDGYDPTLRYRIEIVPEAEQWPKGVGQIAGLPAGQGPIYTTRMGATLSPGQTTGVLYLPRAPCEVMLRLDRERTFERMTIDPRTEAGREVRFVIPPK